MQDKYTATWVSHSSISDFLNCPRSYYLKNVYKDPRTGNKIQIMKPALALGQAVHGVLEGLSELPKDERLKESLPEKFKKVWPRVSGEKGGFIGEEQEQIYFQRGLKMMTRVYNNPGPLKELSVKIKKDLPYFWLSDEENIILCGRIDWMEYLPEKDSVHIIDFKTGKNKESDNSLQLEIYLLLATNCQNRQVDKLSYWYLETDDNLTVARMPEIKEATKNILEIAQKIKLTRNLKNFDCPKGNGCRYCREYEKIVNGEGKLIGQGEFGRDTYILDSQDKSGVDSEIL